MDEQAETEPANLADAELEEVTGGGTGSTSVIRRNGAGYSRARIG